MKFPLYSLVTDISSDKAQMYNGGKRPETSVPQLNDDDLGLDPLKPKISVPQINVGDLDNWILSFDPEDRPWQKK